MITEHSGSSPSSGEFLDEDGLAERLHWLLMRAASSTSDSAQGSSLHRTLQMTARGYPMIAEPGADSDWLRTVRRAARNVGLPLLDALEESWRAGTIDPQAAADAFAEVGRLDALPIHRRREVLLRALRSANAVVRDGAAVGLAASRDPSVSPELRDAADHEPFPILEGFFRNLADELDELSR